MNRLHGFNELYGSNDDMALTTYMASTTYMALCLMRYRLIAVHIKDIRINMHTENSDVDRFRLVVWLLLSALWSEVTEM